MHRKTLLGFTLIVCALLGMLSGVVQTQVLAQLDKTKIAFTSERDGNREIYVMDIDGSNLVNLTKHPASDESPDWSPSGRKIAFASNRDGNFEIYVMNANGSNPIRLTSNFSFDYDPVWSPDGSKIAFASNRDGNWEIYVMNADGTNPTNLTNHPAVDFQPDWSPDGRQIVFASRRDTRIGSDIYVMNADGANLVQLTEEPSSDEVPAWSPDGMLIAFRSLRIPWGIYVMSPAGKRQKIMREGGRMLDWSPDGTQIVFEQDFDLYVMDVKGQKSIQLTNHPAWDVSPAWSPVPSLVVSPKGRLSTLWGKMKNR